MANWKWFDSNWYWNWIRERIERLRIKNDRIKEFFFLKWLRKPYRRINNNKKNAVGFNSVAIKSWLIDLNGRRQKPKFQNEKIERTLACSPLSVHQSSCVITIRRFHPKRLTFLFLLSSFPLSLCFVKKRKKNLWIYLFLVDLIFPDFSLPIIIFFFVFSD